MNVTSSKLTFELEHDARLIARMTGLPVSKVETIMRDFVQLDLFSASEGRIQCLKLAKRCDDFTAKALRANGLQAIESKQVRQTPTNSEKVPLEDRSKNVEDRIEDRKKNKEIVLQKLDFSSWPSEPDKQVLGDWIKLRNKLKAPVTQTVINRLAKQMIDAGLAGLSVDDCLSECVVRGWRGFKAEWLTNKQVGSSYAANQQAGTPKLSRVEQARADIESKYRGGGLGVAQGHGDLRGPMDTQARVETYPALDSGFELD